jgi:hypothetical protein
MLSRSPAADPSAKSRKVDIEGDEKFVFQGAPQLLTKTLTIYFESWDTNFATSFNSLAVKLYLA